VFGASVAVYVVLVVLVIAVAERAVAPRALRTALVAHRVVPRGAPGSVAVAVTAIEAVLAAAILIGLFRNSGPSPVVLTGAAVLFAAYGGYAWHVTASGRGGPCGCGGADVPMDHWVTGRAVVLAVLAAAGAAAHSSVLPLARFDDRVLVVVLAAATIGVLLWHLPAAMTRPQEVTR
jgi:hypothetical protein